MLKRLFFVVATLSAAAPFQVDCLAQRLVHFGTPPRPTAVEPLQWPTQRAVKPLQFPVVDGGQLYQPSDPGYEAARTRAEAQSSALQQRRATEKVHQQLAEYQSMETTLLVIIAGIGVCVLIAVMGLLMVLLKRTRGGAKG